MAKFHSSKLDIIEVKIDNCFRLANSAAVAGWAGGRAGGGQHQGQRQPQ